jgi:hypothetical protein
MRRAFLLLAALVIAIFATGLVLAQEKEPPEQKKPAFVPPSARLAAAKSALVKNAGGSEIPYNVISSGLEGWGRFTLVDSVSQADIIVEVSSPEEEGGVSMSSRTRTGAAGRREESTSTSRNLSSGPIKLVVYDAKTHLPLWTASEQPKSAMRQKTREDNLVQAASTLMTKFRERLEPPAETKK